MKLPPDKDLGPFVLEYVRKCAVSRDTRRSRYAVWRRWAEQGSGGADVPARFNKLAAQLDQLAATLYAQETTRFACHVPPQHVASTAREAEIARDVFARAWHDSDSDLEFGQALEGALVDGCWLLKLVADPVPQFRALDPTLFGVLQEDVPSVEDQEAVCHWYTVSLHQLERVLTNPLAPHPQADAILKALTAVAVTGRTTETQTFPPSLNAILVSQAAPTIVGNVLIGLEDDDPPMVDEPVVELAELWVWDDALLDYRCFTAAEALPDTAIWKRRNPTLKGEQPFVRVCPFPLAGLFWGRSFLKRLVALQQWRTQRMDQVDRLLQVQLRPPKVGTGLGAVAADMAEKLDTPGALVPFGNPMAKIERLKPDMPPDAFAEIKEIDRMFGEQAGQPPLLGGEGDANLRAGGQVETMAHLGSARSRRRAHIIEDCLDAAGTKLFRLLQQVSDTVYTIPAETAQEAPRQFLLSQLPADTTIKVSAHSSSPLFSVATERKAMALMKAGAIDLEDFVEMLDPPMADRLRAKARRLQQAREQTQAMRFQEAMRIKEMQAQKKR